MDERGEELAQLHSVREKDNLGFVSIVLKPLLVRQNGGFVV